MRINNLEFRKCTYLGNIPEHIGWEICKWQPNEYYQKEKDFLKEGDFFCNRNWRIHKDCFKNPEYSYQIASWDWDEDEYVFSFCGDRPTRLSDTEWKDFIKLIKYGFNQL